VFGEQDKQIGACDMSMEYVRRSYGVPAKRGMFVLVAGHRARILSATHRLRIKYLDDPFTGWKVYIHPTDDRLVYVSA